MTKYVGRHRAGESGTAGSSRAGLRVAIPAAAVATAVVGAGVAPASAHSRAEAPLAKARAVKSEVHPGSTEVKRFTASVGYAANLRSAPTLRQPKAVVAKVPSGTALTGRYNSTGYWFRVTQGKWAGRWIAGSLLQKSPRLSDSNGLMNKGGLVPLSEGSARQAGARRAFLSPAAAHAFENMSKAFKGRFGHDLGVVEGYRNLATQKEYANRFGYPRAAIPGTSNHGFGNAIDVGLRGRPGTSSPFYFGHVYDKWLTANGWKWGFDRPAELDARGSNPEFWHYNFVG